MASSLTTIVFDLGGVLVDFNPEYLYAQLIPDAAERAHFLNEVCTQKWHTRHDIGVSFADNAAPLLNQYAGDARMCAWINAWGTRFGEMLRPIEATFEIARELQQNGVALYALTNWPAEAFIPARARFGFDKLFKQIVVSGDEKIVKPNPPIYDLLVARTGIDPVRSVYIDDRAENLPPAKALGFTTIQFTDPGALRAELTRYNLLPLQRHAS